MIGNNFQRLDSGKLLVNAAFVPALCASGLDSFEKIMAHTAGGVMRSVPGRSTVKIELPESPDGKRVAFLKRYEPEYLTFGKKLLRLLRWPGAGDEALHEWNAILRLRASGFNTPTPIAMGQRRSAGIVTRSFLLTAEIAGGIAAHDYLRKLHSTARRDLVKRLAAVTQRFHGAGFAHKDFYLSHIFVVPPEPPACEPELFFIDLQRLARPRLLRERWLVKDLAALGYSAQLAGAKRSDMMGFYKTCFAKRSLGLEDRRRIRKVMARVNALHRRGPRYDVIWDQPGVHPPNV
jgi:hypothetical protein